MSAFCLQSEMAPCPWVIDTFTGHRKPNIFADPELSGETMTPIPWHLQHRLLLTLKSDERFRREMREILADD